MVELVDTMDLKSIRRMDGAGSTPVCGTMTLVNKSSLKCTKLNMR